MQNWLKRHIWTIGTTMVLLFSSTFVLLDTFVVEHAVVKLDTDTKIATNATTNTGGGNTQTLNDTTDPNDISSGETGMRTSMESINDSEVIATATIDSNSYQDDHLSIEVTTYDENGVVYYVADIQTDMPELLRTALANDTFGKNVTATTSSIASENDAILAINGDYYGFRDSGYVVRNGVLLRSSVLNSTTEDLIIDQDGNLSIAYEGDYDVEEAVENGAVDILSFGPALVIDGETVDRVTQNSEKNNPRTAIGQIGEGHYVFIVVDGRTSQSKGVTLDALAQICLNLGCETAYNLDGGGSSTLYFNGEVINNPTDGRNYGERKVSDIVYFGY